MRCGKLRTVRNAIERLKKQNQNINLFKYGAIERVKEK